MRVFLGKKENVIVSRNRGVCRNEYNLFLKL